MQNDALHRLGASDIIASPASMIFPTNGQLRREAAQNLQQERISWRNIAATLWGIYLVRDIHEACVGRAAIVMFEASIACALESKKNLAVRSCGCDSARAATSQKKGEARTIV